MSNFDDTYEDEQGGMSVQYSINFIKSEDCLDLRSRILRPGQDPASCTFPEDKDPTTFHMGVTIGDRIVCVATFMQVAHENFVDSKKPYRLRGMATDSFFQGAQIGTSLMREAFQILQNKGCDLLWCHARQRAFHFYERNGFEYQGDLFEIIGTGPHKVMYKWLRKP